MSDVVSFPILRIGSARYFERLSEDSFAVGGLFAFDSIFDSENVFATLLPAFKVRATALRFLRIEFDCVLGAAN